METDPSVLVQRIAIKVDDTEQSVKNVSLLTYVLHHLIMLLVFMHITCSMHGFMSLLVPSIHVIMPGIT